MDNSSSHSKAFSILHQIFKRYIEYADFPHFISSYVVRDLGVTMDPNANLSIIFCSFVAIHAANYPSCALLFACLVQTPPIQAYSTTPSSQPDYITALTL